MKKPILLLLAAIAIALTETACQRPASEADLATEEQAIRALNQVWFEAENTKDIEAIMSVLAEGIIWQEADRPQIEGLEAVRARYNDVLLPMFVSVSGGPTKIEVAASGDFAYDIGTSRTVFRTPDGTSTRDGRYFVIWKKIDGEWKAVAFTHALQ